MEEHELEEIHNVEETTFKGETIHYIAAKEYCKNADEYIISEEQIKANDLRMKNAYRQKVGLLTSNEILDIRNQYDASQKDFARILGLGELTVTRYENHQIQDKAYDNVLREVRDNPMFFHQLLLEKKQELSKRSFHKIMKQTSQIMAKSGNQYLIQSIFAQYEGYGNGNFHGNVPLNLNKIIDMINYFGSKIENLYVVKLMKLLWYSDFLYYRENKVGITGLCYFKASMGALPKAYDKIILLEGIFREDEIFDDRIAVRFLGSDLPKNTMLTKAEIETIDFVISLFGDLNRSEIVAMMHEEDAYLNTQDKHLINYEFSKTLHC
ncbi:MAG: DUF4065 domain-containing protein [Bacilli bacterium]|nr:DUF4065 domain-containing protein [Bacilli bacterium]